MPLINAMAASRGFRSAINCAARQYKSSASFLVATCNCKLIARLHPLHLALSVLMSTGYLCRVEQSFVGHLITNQTNSIRRECSIPLTATAGANAHTSTLIIRTSAVLCHPIYPVSASSLCSLCNRNGTNTATIDFAVVRVAFAL